MPKLVTITKTYKNTKQNRELKRVGQKYTVKRFAKQSGSGLKGSGYLSYIKHQAVEIDGKPKINNSLPPMFLDANSLNLYNDETGKVERVNIYDLKNSIMDEIKNAIQKKSANIKELVENYNYAVNKFKRYWGTPDEIPPFQEEEEEEEEEEPEPEPPKPTKKPKKPTKKPTKKQEDDEDEEVVDLSNMFGDGLRRRKRGGKIVTLPDGRQFGIMAGRFVVSK